jgi:predicted Zn finger-like uncharacterized protein
MSMQTTCPSCHAVFRVTPEQLAAHAGKVRCGRCAFVFNAYDTLVTPIETVSLIAPMDEVEIEEEHIALEPAPMTEAEKPPESFSGPTDEQIEREAEEINRQIAESAQRMPSHEAERAEQRTKEKAASATAGSRLEITADLQEKLQNLQQELDHGERRARWRFIWWLVAVIVAALVLALQGAYFKRDWLATHYPQMKQPLERMCAILQCEVSLLADVDRVKLESSELQADPDHPNVVVLIASLHNLASYRQAYPNLELTLTDANNQPLARRDFTPREYLPQGAGIERGMPANEEVPVKLSLELIGLNAVGYKLLVYYP